MMNSKFHESNCETVKRKTFLQLPLAIVPTPRNWGGGGGGGTQWVQQASVFSRREKQNHP